MTAVTIDGLRVAYGGTLVIDGQACHACKRVTHPRRGLHTQALELASKTWGRVLPYDGFVASFIRALRTKVGTGFVEAQCSDL